MLTLISIVRIAFQVLNWLIIIRVLLSWIPNNPYNSITRFIYETTEPILSPFRRIMPRGAIPLDFSPIIAILVLQLLERLVISLLYSLL